MMIPSWVYRLGTIKNIFGLDKVASRDFKPGTLEIPEISLGKTRGSKPWITGTIKVPFWMDAGNDSTIASNTKTKGGKPSMADMACPFFGADAPESTVDSMISSMMTEVGGVGGNLAKALSQVLIPIFPQSNWHNTLASSCVGSWRA